MPHNEHVARLRRLQPHVDERTSTVVGGTPAKLAGTRGFPDITANVGAQATDNTYDEWGRRYQLGFNMEF